MTSKYDVWLHRVGEEPTSGYGYYLKDLKEVYERATEWSSFTPATCPHGAMLGGAKCNLCGNMFMVTVLHPNDLEASA
ncbi:hypothetical protein H4CHR_02965 [Variovorax sp. PBS-H4]|uniref:hypothetical protein n=1 Tax=Variovorax sp. PBS-H4 TaxID=434008 RepID=UPI001318A0C4|nr:hypothetical protein [Variovorax sp. PBS-H4]VTU32210.1 hypothetical protein H4CHR_02965 [Variovorax sp. PBS-H4]